MSFASASRYTVLGLPLLLTLAAPSAAARRGELALRYAALDLPGAPSVVVPADVDGDGLRDLVVVVAWSGWDRIGIEETVEMREVPGAAEAGLDSVEGLVEVLTVIPALMDRREVRVFPGRPDGTFAPEGPVLPLETSVLSLEAGPPGLPIVALTDSGLSALRLRDGALALEPVLEDRPVLAGAGTFVPNLGMTRDLDGDRTPDLLFPAADGAAVYLSGPEGLRTEPAARLRFPVDPPRRSGGSLVGHYPLPEVRDVNGDRLPELLLARPGREWEGFRIFRNLGGGRFSGPTAPLGEPRKDPDVDPRRPRDTARVVHVGNLGDAGGMGTAEYVTAREVPVGDNASMRQELAHARRPPHVYGFHRMRPDLSMEPKPYQELKVSGYAFGGGESDIRLPGGFQDLNGDGRQDLVTLTLDFSVFQAVKIMAVRRIGIGLDFHVWCQDPEGLFREVKGLDLSGKFNLDLDNLRLGHLSQFAGDFDGDGRVDFLQMGRGKAVTIHRGRADCSYPARPDLAIQLQEPPRDLGLVQVRDFDGDSLSDLLVIQPAKAVEPGLTPPVRLDFYLSGGAA